MLPINEGELPSCPYANPPAQLARGRSGAQYSASWDRARAFLRQGVARLRHLAELRTHYPSLQSEEYGKQNGKAASKSA